MKIICATNMPYAEEAFSRLGEVRVLAPHQITPAAVRDAEIMAIRSTTQVNRDLLEGSRVRFVGTATIGTDHMDKAYLDAAGITWCYAAGCNANSVAEYTITAMLCMARTQGRPLAGRTLAVIGIGNIGSRLVRKAEALGLRVLQNDPPLQEATGDRVFLPLDEILPQADIVTLHMPLTGDGPHPTRQMANAEFFAKMKTGAIFINAARGALLNSDALLAALESGQLDRVVLDTWEAEPVFRPDVLEQAAIATPHIAGHSFEGKAMGTLLVYQAACRHLGREPDWNYEHLLPEPPVPELTLPEGDPEKLLHLATTGVYDIMGDDRRMRELAGMPDAERAAGFERQRQKYPMRREFRYTRITNNDLDPQLRRQLAGLEFRLDD